ncbi:MAG: type II toxin-antitoxin system RelE/ParE family toxin [Symploca sp. SIO3E6]|nr:type II toxin-antitoxin system RelE/ParE family toxin [Caldora sp. SIO3E6]
MSFYLTKKAKADLKEIARYTSETWGREQRNVYLKKIDHTFHKLSDNPAQGRNCDYIRQGYRKYGIGKHYIFYRTIAPDQIEIVRILHGSMNIEERLGEN